jgi:hypothetical protein
MRRVFSLFFVFSSSFLFVGEQRTLAADLESNTTITKLSITMKDVTSRNNLERVLMRNAELVCSRRFCPLQRFCVCLYSTNDAGSSTTCRCEASDETGVRQAGGLVCQRLQRLQGSGILISKENTLNAGWQFNTNWILCL